MVDVEYRVHQVLHRVGHGLGLLVWRVGQRSHLVGYQREGSGYRHLDWGPRKSRYGLAWSEWKEAELTE